jgi:hypothetical protein
VDNGNLDLYLTESLAQKLGLSAISAEKPAPGAKATLVRPPRNLEIGGITISLEGIEQAHAILNRDSITPGSSAEINLPATVLRHYDVLFDYPNRQFTIGPAGSIPFHGRATQAEINAKNGLIQIGAAIDGQSYSLGLDLTSSATLISAEAMDKWRVARPSWPRMMGAIASSNLWGSDEEAEWILTRVPEIRYGNATLTNVVAATFPAKYLRSFQERAGVETAGLIGATALRNYRVGIDYAHNHVYFEETSKAFWPDTDVVGVTLRPEADGRYTIVAVPEFDGKPAVAGVQAGDVLVGVDGAPATGATMGQVWSLLGGTPGTTRTLTLERDGKRFSADATVRRFLAAGSNTKTAKRP